jgi:Cu2+-containing amine oxidase
MWHVIQQNRNAQSGLCLAYERLLLHTSPVAQTQGAPIAAWALDNENNITIGRRRNGEIYDSGEVRAVRAQVRSRKSVQRVRGEAA